MVGQSYVPEAGLYRLNRRLVGINGSQLQHLVDEVPAAIWQADPGTYAFEFVSKGAEAILGYPVEEWLDDPQFWIKHLHPEDQRWAVSFCQSAVSAGRPHEFEYRMIDAQGRVVWIRDVVKVVSFEGQPPKLVGLMIDVTRRCNSERDKSSVEEQIRNERAAEALAELTSSVAHDFNNTLTVISMHVDLLRNSALNSTASADSLSSVEVALRQAADLTKSLMAIGQDLASDKLVIDLREAVARTHSMLRRILPDSIELRLDNPVDPPIRIRADALRIKQLILNLALDARSSIDNGGILTIALHPCAASSKTDEVAIDVGLHGASAGFARLSIRQEKRSGSSQSGDGDKPRALGLDTIVTESAEHYPSVLDIAEDHGARFGYEPDKTGTTIRIDFPRVPMPSDDASNKAFTIKPMADCEILIAETDQQVRDIVAASLRDLGFYVVPVATWAAFEQRYDASRESVRLVVLGSQFREGAIVDFLTRIRKEGYRTAAIILAESHEAEGADALIKKLSDEWTTLLCKPFSTNSLIGLVQSILTNGGIDP